MKNSITGVLLLNMGGPDTLADVRTFLYNLFSDREIIRLGPAFLQQPLAWLIARRRAPKSREIYAKIGGRSPLRSITEAQARALGNMLAKEGRFVVAVAMRYWQPSSEQALRYLSQEGVERIVVLPLYPQYSRATTGSSHNDLRRAHRRLRLAAPLIEVSSYPEEPRYVEAVANNIKAAAEQFAGEPFTLVYSAHSLPVSFITAGDPYVEETKRTITAIEKLTGIEGQLCYQSRSGPVEWLSPATSETIATLAQCGTRNILMVPISFVSDHVETLYEIGMLFKEEAAGLGMRLVACPSLNTNPTFIAALRDIVLRRLAEWQSAR